MTVAEQVERYMGWYEKWSTIFQLSEQPGAHPRIAARIIDNLQHETQRIPKVSGEAFREVLRRLKVVD